MAGKVTSVPARPMNDPVAQRLAVLRPELLASIRNLSVRAALIVEGTIAGMHRSPYHGFSAEFLEYRAGNRGESTRFIDWRVLARSDRPYLRLFEDETNLSAHLLIDKSASMALASGPMSKFEYGKTLCAALAWILVRQRDSVGLSVFDHQIRAYVPPRATRAHLMSVIAELARQQPSDATGCGMAIDWLAQRLRRRGLCVVVSDLLDDPTRIVRGLRHLHFKRQDVIVLWVLDPLECDFRGRGMLRMRDLETHREIRLDPAVAAAGLSRGLQAHRRIIESACQDLGIGFEPVRTDEPFTRALLRVLGTRERIA